MCTALVLANKFIFSSEDINYPWMMLAVQSGIVTIILQAFLLLNRRSLIRLKLLRQMLLPCVLFTLFIFTNTQSLRRVSLPILSVIRSLSPMGIALAERAIYGDRISTGTGFAMLLLIIANMVTVLSDIESSLDGYLWAFVNVLLHASYIVSLWVCLSSSFTPVEKGLHSNLIAFSIMFPLACVNGQVGPFFDGFAKASMKFHAVFLLSGILCAGIGASVFWVVQVTSGSTLSFLGACDKFIVVILGGWLFQVNITSLGWVSVFFGVLAGVVFAIAKASSERNGAEGKVGAKKAAWETVVEVDNSDSENGEDQIGPSRQRRFHE